MSQISTISEFLLQAGTEYRIFDMGRTIRKLPAQQFLDIENAIKAPQYPRLRHAWFGIVFWNKQLSEQHYIWFIKLPVDEQGMLIPASRNHFLQIIVEALGSELEHAEDKNGQLPENPYTFVPTQQQLADFNSVSRVSLKLGQSEYYQAALTYLNAPQDNHWQTVPLQGITDVVANLADDKVQTLLANQFSQLADEVKFPLLISMENQTVEIKLAERIQHWLQQNPGNATYWQYGLRALCQSPCNGLVKLLLQQCVDSELGKDLPLLTVIGGRHWQHLEDPGLLTPYMENVAALDEQEPIFAAIYTDLVCIPSLRPHILGLLRAEQKSPALTQAIGKLFSAQ